MTQKAVKYIVGAILLLATTTSIWFLIDNLQRLEPALYASIVIILVAVVLFLKIFAVGFTEQIKKTVDKTVRFKYFAPPITALVTMLLGILIRFSFYFKFSYVPVSDPMSYYDAAQKIAAGHGMTGDNYIAFFPHLASYDTLLGLFMKLIPNAWIATITLNTVFDIAGAILIYVLIKRLTSSNSKLPLLGLCVWLLNPFGILFSTLSLPITVVNFFIAIILLIVYLLGRAITAGKWQQTIILALVLGVAAGYGNFFRPVFSIAVVAVFLLFGYLFIKNKSLLPLLGFSFLLIFVVFFSIQKLNILYVSSQTGIESVDSGGWNIYVGSNSETDGTWSELDQERAQVICKGITNNKECQEQLQSAAIDRYKQHGISGTLNLFARKLYRFSSDQASVYNANDSIKGYAGSKTQKVLSLYTVIFMFFLFMLSARFLYKSAKEVLSKDIVVPTILFGAVLMLGFFFSDLLVETSPRYAQVMYPFFTLFAVLALSMRKARVTRHHKN